MGCMLRRVLYVVMAIALLMNGVVELVNLPGRLDVATEASLLFVIALTLVLLYHDETSNARENLN